MKVTERNKIQELKSLNHCSSNLHHLSQFGGLNLSDNIFSKSLVNQLQNQLKQRYGYHISKASLPVLSLYFEYFAFLKHVITDRQSQKHKVNAFPTEYSRYHSQEQVSQLLLQIYNKNREFKKESTIYRQQCLLNYFGVDQITEEKAVALLVDKISKSKINGLIRFQVKRSKKKDKTFFPLIEKENKVKHYEFFSSLQTRKNIAERQNDVYYQILALKMMLKDDNPDPLKTNQICEEIKLNLENLFNTIKLKNIPNTCEFHMKKKSLLRIS